jgi:hypothetical protein
MRVVFERQHIGAKNDLIVHTGYEQEQNENTSFETLTIPSKEYTEIVKLYGLEQHSFPPQKFISAFNILSYDMNNLPWQFILPKETYKIELRKYVTNILKDLESIRINYYTEHYQKQNIVLDNLKRAAIDLRKYESFVSSLEDEPSSGTKVFLKSFNPEKFHNGIWYGGMPEYERTGTITGRLKINKGPNILLLKKEYRQVLKSKWGEDGDIFYLDFKSLEPRALLALKEKNIDIPKDIYTYVAQNMGLDEKIDRKYVKTAIISMIYGAGDKELKKQLSGLVSYPDDFIKSVKEQFGIEELKETLKQQYESNEGKYINNLYNRRIFGSAIAPYVLVNYFAQSTAVDIALFGFSKIVEHLIKTDSIDLIRPIFVLHDALILDVHKSAQKFLPKLAKHGSVGIPGFENVRFWIEIEKIS